MMIFITFMSGNKSLTLFDNRFFHFSVSLRLGFDASKKMKYLAAFNAGDVKREAAEEKKKTGIPL